MKAVYLSVRPQWDTHRGRPGISRERRTNSKFQGFSWVCMVASRVSLFSLGFLKILCLKGSSQVILTCICIGSPGSPWICKVLSRFSQLLRGSLTLFKMVGQVSVTVNGRLPFEVALQYACQGHSHLEWLSNTTEEALIEITVIMHKCLLTLLYNRQYVIFLKFRFATFCSSLFT